MVGVGVWVVTQPRLHHPNISQLENYGQIKPNYLLFIAKVIVPNLIIYIMSLPNLSNYPLYVDPANMPIMMVLGILLKIEALELASFKHSKPSKLRSCYFTKDILDGRMT